VSGVSRWAPTRPSLTTFLDGRRMGPEHDSGVRVRVWVCVDFSGRGGGDEQDGSWRSPTFSRPDRAGAKIG